MMTPGLRRLLGIGAAVLAVLATLFASGVFDPWGMDAYTQRKLAELRRASPGTQESPGTAASAAAAAPGGPADTDVSPRAAAPSAPGSGDIAGDAPHAELTAPTTRAGSKTAFRPPPSRRCPAASSAT